MLEGKTKVILEGPQTGTVILKAKDDITARDAARVDEIDSIGIMRTTQATNVAALLATAGVPVAYLDRIDERSQLCWDCDMIPVEFVVRRVAWGSYLVRHPASRGTPGSAEVFDDLVVERFLKHALVLPPAADEPTVIREGDARGRFLRGGTWAEGVFTDPYVEPRDDRWYLHPAKQPLRPGTAVHSIAAPISDDEDQLIRDTILLPAFTCLEQAWREIETKAGRIVLADCKFEIGRRRTDGALVLADVVDNDSWRIWPGGDPRRQLDKQSFRDGRSLADVEAAYAEVTELTSRLRPSTP